MTIIRPMLAEKITLADLPSLRYPKEVQLKLDGIRAICIGGLMISRSGKQLPNRYVQEYFRELHKRYPQIEGIDGEFIVGESNAPQVCMTTTSGIMSHAGQPNFTFYAFDVAHPQCATTPYTARFDYLSRIIDSLHGSADSIIQQVQSMKAVNAADAEMYLSDFLDHNHEGGILRDPLSPYKNGRSTRKQEYLLKFKDIRDAEAIIVGVEELYRNGNEAFESELGFTKRSAHQENKVAASMLGALVCVSPLWEGEFRVGTGFDMETRKNLWAAKPFGEIIKFKYLAAGMKDLPRHPSFVDFRSPLDMDPVLVERLARKAAEYHARTPPKD